MWVGLLGDLLWTDTPETEIRSSCQICPKVFLADAILSSIQILLTCQASLEMKDHRFYVSILFTYLYFIIWLSVTDEELSKRSYDVDQEYFANRVKEYVKIYNYTIDQKSLINAITFMYSPWTDPNNRTLIRQGLIDVCSNISILLFRTRMTFILYVTLSDDH